MIGGGSAGGYGTTEKREGAIRKEAKVKKDADKERNDIN